MSFGDIVRYRSRRGDIQRSTEMNGIELERLLDDAEEEGSWETAYTSMLNVSADDDDGELSTRARLDGSKDSQVSLAPASLSLFGDVSTRHNSSVNLAGTLLFGRLARRRVERRKGLHSRRRTRSRARRGLWVGLEAVNGKGDLLRLGRLSSSRSSSRTLCGMSGSRSWGGSRDEVEVGVGGQ